MDLSRNTTEGCGGTANNGDQGGFNKSLVLAEPGAGSGPGELLSCPCEVCGVMTNKMPNRQGSTHTQWHYLESKLVVVVQC